MSDLTPDAIRRFLLSLEETGHNPGGVHANYRAVRAFLRWYEDECEPENWKNPIRKVRAPKYPEVVIDPIEVETWQTPRSCHRQLNSSSVFPRITSSAFSHSVFSI